MTNWRSCHVGRERETYLHFPPLIAIPSPPLSKRESYQYHLLINKFRNRSKSVKQSTMASTSAVSMAMPLTYTSQKRLASANAFFKPVPVRPSKAIAASKSAAKFEVKASLKEKAVTGLTAAALTASMMMPEVAEAAGSGVSPSLKNFLLSIVAGGVVLGAILGAIIAVANFDPVKRA